MSWKEWFSKNSIGFTLLFILASVAFATLFTLRIQWAGNYSVELGGVEYYVVSGIQNHLHTGILYPNPFSDPYITIQYAPLYYESINAYLKLKAISVGQAHDIFVANRSLAIVFQSLLFIMIYLIGKRLQWSTRNALSWAMLSFIFAYEHSFGRPDVLYSFLIVSSIFFYTIYRQSKGIFFFYLTILAIVLATYSKQTGVLFLFGWLALDFLLELNFKRTFLAILFALILILLLYLPYRNEYLVDNVIFGVNNGVDLSLLWKNRYLLEEGKWYILLWGISLWFTYHQHKKELWVWHGYAFIFLMIASGTIVKIGSDVNYFYEFNLMVIGILIFITANLKPIYSYGLVSLFILIFFAHTYNMIHQENEMSIIMSKKRYELDVENQKWIRNQLKPEDKIILFNEKYHWQQHLLFDKATAIVKTVMQDNYQLGYNQYDKLREDIKNGKIAMIIDLSGDLKKGYFLDLPFDLYHQDTILNGNTHIYRLKHVK